MQRNLNRTPATPLDPSQLTAVVTKMVGAALHVKNLWPMTRTIFTKFAVSFQAHAPRDTCLFFVVIANRIYEQPWLIDKNTGNSRTDTVYLKLKKLCILYSFYGSFRINICVKIMQTYGKHHDEANLIYAVIRAIGALGTISSKIRFAEVRNQEGLLAVCQDASKHHAEIEVGLPILQAQPSDASSDAFLAGVAQFSENTASFIQHIIVLGYDRLKKQALHWQKY